ncbi:unnamed protein product [Microthlaspi erraticum]|uniref:Desiccation-related protein PCC13-62 n=1 Tax=Microthlaspi erraticum TaxID=1685480 RepID=A0A6D2JVG2_9BRAS|nr:unnamed protein product [Microthlaspi erraticum]
MGITKERRSLLVSTAMVLFFFNIHHLQVMSCPEPAASNSTSCTDQDRKLLEFPLNLEYLEAEFFLFGALGFGLDKVAPNLTMGGPSPFGAQKANLDPLTRDVILQFAWQEVGHLRAIKKTVKGFARPQLDLSIKSFAKVMNDAVGKKLIPPFNPYANSFNYLIASYLVPYVGLTGYVGANPKLQCPASRKLVAGLLGVESGQDAVIRTMLYARAKYIVHPYGITVAEFTNKISILRNKLGKKGLKDEGLVVPKLMGAEGQISGNVLAGDEMSLAYDRTPEEILRIVYGSGNESVPGGFYPMGGDGEIAKSYLVKK